MILKKCYNNRTMSKTDLSNEDILKLADLAKIEISSSELEEYKININNILTHLSLVAQAETTNTPSSQKFFNSLRSDSEDLREFNRELIFTNIPSKTSNNYIKVSKVLSK